MSEQTRVLNWKRQPSDERDLISLRHLTAPKQLPTEFELDRQIPVEDQGSIGSCFHGETMVPLLNGNERSLRDLSNGVEGEKFWVYGIDIKTGNFIPAQASARLTRKDVETISVHLDNGNVIQCTPDHEFLSRDGNYIQAQNLEVGQSLMALKRMISERGYELIFDNIKNKFCYTHWKVKTHFQTRPNKDVIHHKDFNKRNNAPDNLEFMGWIEHRDLHSSLGVLNFKNYHGTEKQREDSRRTALKMHRENPGWNLHGCSKGGKTAWQNAQDDPERLEEIRRWHELGRTPEVREKAAESLREYFLNRSDGERQLHSKRSKESYQNSTLMQNVCRENGKRLGGQKSNEYQCAKLGSEVLFKLNELNETNWNLIRDSYTEEKILHRNRNGNEQEVHSNYNCKPKFKTAIKVFKTFDNLLIASQNYNCKVVKIEPADRCDVYCLSVPETENFALSAGVFVHNCVANSACTCFRYEVAQLTNNFDFVPSRLFEYYNARLLQGWENEDSGAYIRDGFKAMNKYGLCLEKTWPYITSKFASKPPTEAYNEGLKNVTVKYASVVQNLQIIKETLVAGAAVSFGFDVYSSFYGSWSNTTGIMPIPKSGENLLGGHAVVICGFSDSKQCFLIQNSWGYNWGLNGKFWMPYSYALNPSKADDFWAIQEVKVDGVNTPPTPSNLDWKTVANVLFKTSSELYAVRKPTLIRLGQALNVEGLNDKKSFSYNYNLIKTFLGL